ncbi:MAG: FAD-dependent oxidoreductase [Bdellovibrionaceae bacterium]|nr:FAD-dependent oxidoreductase [Pseudobdellovibrionaceae bacterium]|tara:strand:+ start:1406 stop:2695 length:1290 start_codon:yes stop_codon:yes gene_type:complete
MKKKVIIIGGGFAGLAAAQRLSNQKNISVTLIDRRNHHLFQPLLYQVAMAGLNPSDISVPLRKLFSRSKNITTLMAEIETIDLEQNKILMDEQWKPYDYLIVACGSKHFYFGKNEWEEVAPGLKTIEQATEIRRRVLLAFELAEKETDEEQKKALLTFVIIGGGPTGIELAGSIAEMTRYTLYKDYKKIDLKKTRVVLVEAGNRILKAFPEKLSQKAKKDLQNLGVEIILGTRASNLTSKGIQIGDQTLKSYTLIWAAGVKPAKITEKLNSPLLPDGRVKVTQHLTLPKNDSVFVLGDQAACFNKTQNDYLPGLAPVAIQQGKYAARTILNDLKGKNRKPFCYVDKGMMATIGRSKAVVQTGKLQFTGLFAWVTWVVVHIAYLVRFKNRVFVILQWAWSYFKFGSGARLIVHKTWKFYSGEKIPISKKD